MTKNALLFPGQGSQYVGMGKSFFASAKARAILRQAEDALNLPLEELMLDGPLEALTATAVAQPAILLHSILALNYLRDKKDFNVSAVLGHSLGEYSALVAAGVLDLFDALKLVRLRGQLMQEASPKGFGSMLAVLGMESTLIEEVLIDCQNPDSENYAVIANYNGPSQTVIAGKKAGLLLAMKALKDAGARRIVELEVSAPFHCALMSPMRKPFAAALEKVNFKPAQFPLISNVSTEAESKPERIKELLIEQLLKPVRFTACVHYVLANNLAGDGFIELGPKNILSAITKKIDSNIKVTNLDNTEDIEKF
jgi:[acyl-carrier-protein] S-malonyltransferase